MVFLLIGLAQALIMTAYNINHKEEIRKAEREKREAYEKLDPYEKYLEDTRSMNKVLSR